MRYHVRESSAVKWDPQAPYSDLPPLPPGVDLQTRAILRQAARAHVALGQLTGYCAMLPSANGASATREEVGLSFAPCELVAVLRKGGCSTPVCVRRIAAFSGLRQKHSFPPAGCARR